MKFTAIILASLASLTDALVMPGQSILQTMTGKTALDPVSKQSFDGLKLDPSKLRAEYVWIDAIGNTRSKTRTLPSSKNKVGLLPDWNFDGSSTGQAPGEDSEVIIKPRAVFRDPFRPNQDNILVLCDTNTPGGAPLPTNTRANAAEIFAAHEKEEVWFGMEQEYTLFNLDQKTPLGWPVGGFPGPQGPYYCGAGAENMFGRQISEAHYAACLFAGLDISGTNGEVMPGQWEYQVGPCVGIDAGDQLWASRYILQRVCEEYQVFCTLHPKPITQGDWNGAGMHTNMSTKKMREAGGLAVIKAAINKLAAKHVEHMGVYGEGNELRMTGALETSSMDEFSYGVANRGCSVRIGRDTEKDGCGYFEDRRPSSNCDPYIVSSKLMHTIMEDVEVPEFKAIDRALA